MTTPTSKPRERFSSLAGQLLTMIGVAVGLGNVWRFPYMAGKFGGASFVLFYVLTTLLVGIPALQAELALGRHTRRGPVGAFFRAGLPGGRAFGFFVFFVVTGATAYYSNAVGWVLYYAVGQLAALVGLPWAEAAILPPQSGFDPRSMALQIGATAVVLGAAAAILVRGLRGGIEKASKVLIPLLLIILLTLIVRSLTLPGAWAGVQWYLLKIDFAALTPGVMLAALGQAVFSLSLGGTFMVIYGSYLDERENLGRAAGWTATGDVGAGLLAGLAILPAVFALGLEPAAGPGLLFSTLPRVFAELPFGALFGFLFFAGLFGAAYLSVIGAFEVLVAGVIDQTGLSRRRAVAIMVGVVFLLSLVPMINMAIFVPWDLTFGSGMQTLGALVAVVTFAWALDRGTALGELTTGRPAGKRVIALYLWLRFGVPVLILAIGVWWVVSDLLGIVGAS